MKISVKFTLLDKVFGFINYSGSFVPRHTLLNRPFQEYVDGGLLSIDRSLVCEDIGVAVIQYLRNAYGKQFFASRPSFCFKIKLSAFSPYYPREFCEFISSLDISGRVADGVVTFFCSCGRTQYEL